MSNDVVLAVGPVAVAAAAAAGEIGRGKVWVGGDVGPVSYFDYGLWNPTWVQGVGRVASV